jgi:hypothetical protein
MTRFDYAFSYWLFAWYIAYMLKLVQYNPFIFLVIATFVDFLELLFGYIKSPFLFIIINFFMKIIPIYTLMYSKSNKNDINAGLVYAMIYILWMFVNKESVFKVRTPLTDYLRIRFIM